MKKIIFLLCFLFIFQLFSPAQKTFIDSLHIALKSAVHDTLRCRILNNLTELIFGVDPDSAIKMCQSSRKIAEKNLSLKNDEQTTKRFRYLLAVAYNNSASLAGAKGNISEALSGYEKSKKLMEIVGDKNGTAQAFSHIASICRDQGDDAKAFEYYQGALKLYEEGGDKDGMAQIYNNIGLLFKSKKDFQRALEYYDQSLEIVREMGNRSGIAHCYSNIGEVYHLQGNSAKALQYILKTIEIEEEVGDKRSLAFSCSNIASLYLKQKNYNKAEEYSLRSLKLAREIGFPENIRNASRRLYMIYKLKGNHKQAFQYFDLYIQMRDSISNTATKKAAIKTQLKYEFEKRAAADSVKNAEAKKLQNAELAAQQAQIKQEKIQRYSLIAGLLLVIGGLLFVVNRFRVTQKQKKIIESQKVSVDDAYEKLHEKNKEVMDSIYYARRIQQALITSEKYIARNLSRLNSRAS